MLLYELYHITEKLRKYLCIIFISLLLSGLSTGCTASVPSSVPVSRTGLFFDTVISVTLYEYEGSSEAIFDECMNMCEHYESLFSSTVEGSDIWRINNAADTEPVTVDPETAQLISTALNYCDSSGGVLDLTAGGLCDLWDIRSQVGSSSPVIPDKESIAEALSHINYRNVSVSGNTVQITDPAAKITLGFIAKGYVADRMAEYLTGAGVASALIDLGGNIKAVGTKPGGADFHIGIQKPFADKGEALTKVSIRDLSVVSSGVYERYFTYDDHIYHHIFDLKKGYPVDNGVLGVTVICSSSTQADVYSTLCLILGIDEGLNFIEESDGVEAMFITSDQICHYSSGWQEFKP